MACRHLYCLKLSDLSKKRAVKIFPSVSPPGGGFNATASKSPARCAAPFVKGGFYGGKNLHFEIELLSGGNVSVTRMAGTGAGAVCIGITGLPLWVV